VESKDPYKENGQYINDFYKPSFMIESYQSGQASPNSAFYPVTDREINQVKVDVYGF
jgi:hypothetical protein